MPPTTPPCTVSLCCVGMYSMSLCASLEMGRVCSQILPGPASDARKIPSPPKNHVLDSRHGRDLKGNARLERAGVPRIPPQGFARLQVLHDQLTRKLDPCGSRSADVLQQEAVAAENSRPQRLLEADADLDLRRR